eukprot:TRINITY_DN1321_c0_g1_i2.p1 TRINITY_DN1321_c0_g1~~TRINITY_DN1321_c0_g1_i2.p1  ORF type:complete len:948 (+),score=188.99 TRINITY_DN1321_c0_g1_i2:115-2958(+)
MSKPLGVLPNAVDAALESEELEDDVGSSSKAALTRAATVVNYYTLPYEEQKDKLGEPLYKFLKSLDPQNTGVLTSDDIGKVQDILKVHRPGAGRQSAGISMDAFDDMDQDVVKEIISAWDANGDGRVSLKEIKSAAVAAREKNYQMRWLKMLVFGMLILALTMTVSNFVTAYFAIELAKEVKAERNSGTLKTSDGHTVKTASAEFKAQNGMLVAQDGSGTRRLQACANGDSSKNVTCGAETNALATRPAEIPKTLSSTIPDRLIKEMAKITITGVDKISHMTIHITGFSRALAPSKCGSLVYLSSQHGTITLDDTDLHFDASLAARAENLGIELGEMSAMGRRLSSGFMVAGLFSFFDDYEWECSSVLAPKSPTKPYVMHTLKKTPCPTAAACNSKLSTASGTVTLPGFDEESNAVVSAETIVETDKFVLSIRRFANHPYQQRVQLVDHVQKNVKTFQVFKGEGYFCQNDSYAAVVDNATDTMSSYFPAYQGKAARPEMQFHLPWGLQTVPARNVRVFRLQPKPDVDGALPLPVDYEDDETNLLPTQLSFIDARELDFDVEEIVVQNISENAAAYAQQLYNAYVVGCGETGNTNLEVPQMTSPLEEELTVVDFYVQQYIADDDMDRSIEMSEYWKKAMQIEDESNLQAEQTNQTRRLLSPRDRQRRLQFSGGQVLFELDMGSGSKLSASQGGAVGPDCLAVTGSMQNPGSPWQLSGTLALGMHCAAPANRFSVDGSVRLSYGWKMKKDFKLKVLFWKTKISFECGLELYGVIGGRAGEYSYDCGRRLDGISHDTGLQSTSNLTDPGDSAKEDNAAAEADRAMEEDEVSELDESLEESSESMTKTSASRALLSPRRLSGRRRRRRRRRMCPVAGFEVYAGIGLAGGCGVSRRRIGVSLEGGLGLTLGPWPAPLDARAKGSVSAKGCIKIGPFKGCVGLPSISLFDVDI